MAVLTHSLPSGFRKHLSSSIQIPSRFLRSSAIPIECLIPPQLDLAHAGRSHFAAAL
jgi:hypothetical protein